MLRRSKRVVAAKKIPYYRQDQITSISIPRGVAEIVTEHLLANRVVIETQDTKMVFKDYVDLYSRHNLIYSHENIVLYDKTQNAVIKYMLSPPTTKWLIRHKWERNVVKDVYPDRFLGVPRPLYSFHIQRYFYGNVFKYIGEPLTMEITNMSRVERVHTFNQLKSELIRLYGLNYYIDKEFTRLLRDIVYDPVEKKIGFVDYENFRKFNDHHNTVYMYIEDTIIKFGKFLKI